MSSNYGTSPADEIRIDEILESITDAFYSVDSQWRLTYVNKRAEQWYGRSREDLLGTLLWDMSPEPEKTEGWLKHHEAMETRLPMHWETFSPNLKVWVVASAYPISSGGIAVYFRDITERKREEEAQENKKYKILFDSLNEGYSICDVVNDEKGNPIDFRYLEVNKAYEVHTGLKADEIVGKTLLEIAPDMEPSWIEMLSNIARTGEPQKHVDYNRSTKRYYDTIIFSPQQGKIAVILKDVTAQTQTKEALRESEERLLALTMASANVVYRMSPDWSSMAELYGNGFLADTEEPNGNWLSKYIHPDDQEFVTGVIHECIREKKTFELEHRVLQADGNIGWTYSRAVPLPNGNGEIKEWFGAASDITGRKRMEHALRESEKIAVKRTRELEEANRLNTNILESISDCFYTLDKDLRFIYANKAAEEIWGLSQADLIGRRIEDVFPNLIDISLSKFRQVLEERTPQHYEVYSNVVRRWDDMSVYPTRDGISVCFRDTTERKRLEQQQALLSEISRELVGLNTIEETMDRLSEKIGRHFGVVWAMYAELVEDNEYSIASLGWNADGAISLKGTYRMRDFLTDEQLTRNNAGVLTIVSDTQADPRVSAETYGALGIRSFIILPISRDGQWRFQLSIIDVKTREWRDDEVALLREIADRIWTRLERARAEEALRDSERKYRTIIETTGEGIIMAKPQGDYFYVNQRFADMIGYSVDELLGKSTTDLSNAQEHEQVMRARREIDKSAPLQGEFKFLRKDGTTLWTIYNATSVFDDRGEHISNIIMITDITEKKKAEVALRESKEKYRELVENANSAIIRMDKEGIISHFNEFAQSYFGYSSEEAIGMNIRALVPPTESISGRDLKEMADDILEDPDEFVENINENVKKSGERVWVSWRNKAIRNSAGEIIGNLAIGQDVTERRRMEEALRASEERLRFVLESCNIGAWDMDLENHTTIRNPEHDKIYGYDSMLPEWTYEKFLEHVIPEDRARVDTVFQQAVKAKTGWTFEFRIRRPDGQLRWIWAIGNHKKDPDGVIRRVAGTVIDVTEKKLAEGALRESEERHAFLLKLNDAIRDLDGHDDISRVTACFIGEWMGVDRAGYGEVIWENGEECFRVASDYHTPGMPDLYGISYPVAAFGPAVTDTIHNGRTLAVSDIETDERFTPKEREAYSAVNIRAFVNVPLIKEGRCVANFGIQQRNPRKWTPNELILLEETVARTWVTSERARAEEALRESEARLTELSRNLAAEVDALRLFQQINMRFIRQEEIHSVYKDILDAAMFLTGADCGNLQLALDEGQALEIIVHAGLSEAFVQYFQRVSDDMTSCARALQDRARVIVSDVSMSPVFDDVKIRRVMLQEGICCVQSTPLFSGAGNFMGVFSTHYKSPHEFSERELRVFDLLARQAADVIERMKTEEALKVSWTQERLLAEALERKNRLVTDFFINISHEFKTPLTIMMLGLELLEAKAKRMKGGGEAFVGNLSAMKQNSYRLNRLVANLLDITKLDAGFMEPKWEKLDIRGLLKNLAQSVEPYAKQKQLRLDYCLSTTEFPFTTDAFMIERIVLNLLSNAIKHTPAGGQISLACQTKASGISITVKDTGEGIPEGKKAIIFDRFSQVDTSMTRASEGTGIGLALTKSLVELLGGRVSFESTLGVGSTFMVELPVIQRTPSSGVIEKIGMQIDKRVQMELSDIV